MKLSVADRTIMEFLSKAGGTRASEIPCLNRNTLSGRANILKRLQERGYLSAEQSGHRNTPMLWAVTPSGYTELLTAREK